MRKRIDSRKEKARLELEGDIYGNGCRGKKGYPSKAHADAAVRLAKRDRPRGDDNRLSSYKCRACRKWHWGREGVAAWRARRKAERENPA